MKRWFLISVVLLLSSAWLVAQSSSAPQDKSQSSQPSGSAPQDNSQSNQPSSTSQQPDTSQKEPASSGHAHTIEGCITSVAGGYTLTDNSGKTYQLTGDTSKLANENGHYDQVSGTEESSAGGAAASSGGPSTFTVRKIKVVSTTCPTK